MLRHSYGCIPDKPDTRDLQYQALRLAPLPPSVDLRNLCSPVRNQLSLGACTGFATAVGLREFLLNKQGVPFVGLSPLFLYYEERRLEHTVNEDCGAQPRDAMKVLAQIGCATETDDPYDPANFARPVVDNVLADALAFKINAYHRLGDLDNMKSCLADGKGFIMGFTVFQSFESEPVNQTGKMPMPVDGESVLGSHAVFCAGYVTDATWPGGGYLIVKNSWGADWGDQGYFYMPWAFVTPQHVPDAWTAVI
jgi:C1A family cysteine protease